MPLNLSKLQAAADRRASRTAKEQAIATELGNQGAKGSGMRRGAKTYFVTDKGNVVCSSGRVRLTNKGPTLELPSLAKMRNVVKEFATERAQVRALVELLAVSGVNNPAKPEIQTTSNKGLLVRAYLWKTSEGIVVLATGPRFEPQVKIVTGGEDIARIPAEVVVGFGTGVSDDKRGRLTARMGRSAQRAKRQATRREREAEKRRAAQKKRGAPPKRKAPAKAPAKRKPAARKTAAPKRKAAPKRAPKRAAAAVTPPPALTAADLEMLSSLMDQVMSKAD